ncbi:MAG: hypothetical protein ACTS7E_03595 [Arsenophonus sp. NC-CH8-MAG3]
MNSSVILLGSDRHLCLGLSQLEATVLQQHIEYCFIDGRGQLVMHW